MPGISSSLGYYLIGKQSGKGSVATTWFRYRVSAEPSLEPQKVVNRYHMTDTGRDQGDAYLSVVQVTGDIQIYLHPDGSALPFYLALGTNVDSGAGPNFTHTITPANDLPWFSVFRVVGGVLTEQFVDCKLNVLRLESDAGDTPLATLSIMGITPTWAAEPGAPTAIVGDPYKHWEGKSLLSVGGAPRAISRLNLEISNNLGAYQADDYFLNDVDPGKREVTFGYTMRFTGPTNEPKYREFMYGSDAGTAVSTVLPTKAVDFTFRRDVNTEVKVAMTNTRHVAVPVQPDPGGDPIEVEVATVVEKPVGGSILTATIKDQNATVG